LGQRDFDGYADRVAALEVIALVTID
jgi:hypothetical protein